MVNRTFVVTLLVAAALAAATTGVWGSDPNKPVDVAQAMDVTDIVNPEPKTTQPDPAAIARSRAIPSVDETNKATRVIARGEKADVIRARAIYADQLVVGSGKAGQNTGRASVTSTRPAGLSRKDKAKINKAGQDAEQAKNDAEEAKVAAARAKADALAAKNDSAAAKTKAIAASEQATEAKTDSKRALTISNDTNEKVASLEKKLGLLWVALTLVLIVAIMSFAHSTHTSRRLDGAIDASRRLAGRVVALGRQVTEFIESVTRGGA